MKGASKEKAFDAFFTMIEKSWTWERLTQEEQFTFFDTCYKFKCNGVIKGDFDSRWRILQAMYESFLNGCGYCHNVNWRKENANAS